MRISIIVPSFYPATVYGGPIFSILNICEALSKHKNLEIKVSTTNTNKTSKLDVEVNVWIKFKENFFVKYYDETVIGKFSLFLFFNIWKDIKKADVVHLQALFNSTTPISLLYAKIFKKPILFTPRGSLCEWCLKQGNHFKKAWISFLIKPLSKNILWHVTSYQEKNDVLKIFPNVKVKIITNGVNYEEFQVYNILSQKEYIIKFAGKELETDKIVVSMGRLQKVKGFDILIDSFAKIQDKYPKSKLFIAGEDEGERQNLKKQIQKYKFEDKIFLIGNISGQDKIDFLANSDLFVLPSHSENFGNVYVESLAAGTPIVASKNTPWQKVEEYKCGKWVKNNVEDTVQAMLLILEKDRKQMRINAKKLAEKYDWKNIALQFKELFEDMVEK